MSGQTCESGDVTVDEDVRLVFSISSRENCGVPEDEPDNVGCYLVSPGTGSYKNEDLDSDMCPTIKSKISPSYDGGSTLWENVDILWKDDSIAYPHYVTLIVWCGPLYSSDHGQIQDSSPFDEDDYWEDGTAPQCQVEDTNALQVS